MKRTKILRNTFISVGVLFAVGRLLAGGMSDGIPNFGNMPLGGAIITIDAPDAGTGPGQGTLPQAINPAGMIVGYYFDANTVTHSFVRTRDGIIITFDAPGGGHTPYSYQGTFTGSINSAGATTGDTRDSNDVHHGFLRARDGAITTFDAPGAGTGFLQGTFCSNINAEGVINGSYADSSNVYHGFVRAADGTITPFDAPGAGTGPGQGTCVNGVDCLNEAGTTVGAYIDTSNVYHGLLRAADGTITTFDVPGAGTGAFQGTQAFGINPGGTIEGIYTDASGLNHGFVRAADGTITTLDAAGAGTGPGQGTTPANINASRAITGWYTDASNVNHGFSLSKHGALATFDVPGAGTGPGQGTTPYCNNARDAITGFYVDSNNTWHGFLREPLAVPRSRP